MLVFKTESPIESCLKMTLETRSHVPITGIHSSIVMASLGTSQWGSFDFKKSSFDE